MKARIAWGRVILAAVMSEMAVIIVLLAITGVYILFSHKATVSDIHQFGTSVGYYVAPLAAGLCTFVAARWAIRSLKADLLLNGTLVGVAATILTVGMFFGATPGDRVMYLVSFVIRIAAGYAAGATAKPRAALLN